MSDCDLWLIITTRGDNGYSFSQFLLNTLANHCGVFSCPVRARSQMSEINWVSTFFSLVGAIRTKYRKKYIKCRVIASTYPVAFSYSYGKLLGGELISQVWLQKRAPVFTILSEVLHCFCHRFILDLQRVESQIWNILLSLLPLQPNPG